MRLRNLWIGVILLATALAASGCEHRLIPNSGDKVVRVYEREEVYDAILEINGKLADPNFYPAAKPTLTMILAGAEKQSRDVDGGTRVKVLSSDSKGSKVEVLEGVYIGFKGFVLAKNLR